MISNFLMGLYYFVHSGSSASYSFNLRWLEIFCAGVSDGRFAFDSVPLPVLYLAFSATIEQEIANIAHRLVRHVLLAAIMLLATSRAAHSGFLTAVDADGHERIVSAFRTIFSTRSRRTDVERGLQLFRVVNDGQSDWSTIRGPNGRKKRGNSWKHCNKTRNKTPAEM